MDLVTILILAAGFSRRMGRNDKLLMPLSGTPLLRHVVARAAATGGPVCVALPARDRERRALLAGLAVTIAPVADPTEGMAAALRAGLAGISRGAVLVGLADMPDLTTQDYKTLISAYRDDPAHGIQRAARHDGTPGNPVLLPRWALDGQDFTGDRGARDVLKRNAHLVRLVKLPENNALVDLDTPQDWRDWQARQPA